MQLSELRVQDDRRKKQCISGPISTFTLMCQFCVTHRPHAFYKAFLGGYFIDSLPVMPYKQISNLIANSPVEYGGSVYRD